MTWETKPLNSGHPLSHPRSPRVRSATSSRALSRSPALRQPAPPTCVGLCFPRPSRSLKGTRCTHLSNCMRYRDPARRAVWMRECRKRKRTAQRSALVLRASSPSIVRAPEPSRVLEQVMERPGPQPMHPKRMEHSHVLQRAYRRALPDHYGGLHQRQHHSGGFLPLGSQCLREQCRIEIQRAGRKAMLQLDSWRAPENACGRGGASILREEFKQKLEQGPVDHETEFKCGCTRTDASRPRDSAAIGWIFGTSNRKRNWSFSRHDPANPSCKGVKAFYTREAN